MKNFLIVALMLLSSFCIGQSAVSITSAGGTVKSTATQTLQTPTGSPVIAINLNGTLSTGTLGTLSFETPALSTGDFQTGATFGSGGVFMVNSPGYVDYVGNFSNATWTENTLANGNHYYSLSGDLTSTEGTGAFVCTTATLPHGNVWSASAKIDNCQVSLNLVF